MCTLFSLCLGYVKARSSANILLEPKSVFQQNKDKKTIHFFFSLWIELMFLKHWCWHYSTVRCGYSHQLLPYSSGATWNFAVMNSTVHSSFMPMCKLAFQMLLNISLVTVTSFSFYMLSSICFPVFTSFLLLSYPLSHRL